MQHTPGSVDPSLLPTFLLPTPLSRACADTGPGGKGDAKTRSLAWWRTRTANLTHPTTARAAGHPPAQGSSGPTGRRKVHREKGEAQLSPKRQALADWQVWEGRPGGKWGKIGLQSLSDQRQRSPLSPQGAAPLTWHTDPAGGGDQTEPLKWPPR